MTKKTEAWKMKKFSIFTALVILLFTGMNAFSETLPLQSKPVAPAYAVPDDCIKLYEIPFEKLYYLSLSAVNANGYKPLEMQSRSGYILFETANQELLLSVMKKDAKHAFVKIAPANNIYKFSKTIPEKIYQYIDTNKEKEITDMKFN